jgi:hypothetical protein
MWLVRLASHPYSSVTVTKPDLAQALHLNARQLTAALDMWIDRAELNAQEGPMAETLRALCLHRARDLYAERARLRLALRRLDTPRSTQ